MSIEGDICELVRTSKKKDSAINIACELYGRTRPQVIETLQQFGLMDANGNHIERTRLTGKEITMDQEKRKINYPSFAWSPKRKEKLAELYQDGKSVNEIADHFGTDEETVYKAIDKHDLVRTNKREPPAPSAADNVPSKIDLPLKVYVDRPEPNIHMPSQLEHLLHFVVDAANHNNDAMAALVDKKENEACFELGQQCAKLSEAVNFIRLLINAIPGQ